MREKLIELLRDAAFKSQDLCLSYGNWCDGCPYINEDAQGCRFAIMVDHLIANGVTVQKRGNWEKYGYKWKCNNCLEKINIDGTPEENGLYYCPNCGADMRAGGLSYEGKTD